MSSSKRISTGMLLIAALIAPAGCVANAHGPEPFREGEPAIVLRDGAELREAPDPRATTRAHASEGGSARVLARDQGYARVRTSSGAVGWMSDADVALIVD